MSGCSRVVEGRLEPAVEEAAPARHRCVPRQLAASRRRRFAGLALFVVTAMVVAAVAVRGVNSGKGQRAADRYLKDVQGAFAPLTVALGSLLDGQQQWIEGTRTSEQYAGQLDSALPEFENVRQAIAKVDPRHFASAHRFLSATAAIYVEFVRAEQIAVGASEARARDQLDLIARRIRVLGDRLYDRGRAALDPDIFESANQNINLRFPAEVPDFAAEGLAAGPPLDDPPPPASPTPRLRTPHRQQQSEQGWRRALTALAIPPVTAIEQAAAGGDATRLRALARQLTAAVAALESVPDPDGNRERAAALRLGLLLQAESARTAQAAIVFADSADVLERMTTRLMGLGESLESEHD